MPAAGKGNASGRTSPANLEARHPNAQGTRNEIRVGRPRRILRPILPSGRLPRSLSLAADVATEMTNEGDDAGNVVDHEIGDDDCEVDESDPDDDHEPETVVAPSLELVRSKDLSELVLMHSRASLRLRPRNIICPELHCPLYQELAARVFRKLGHLPAPHLTVEKAHRGRAHSCEGSNSNENCGCKGERGWATSRCCSYSDPIFYDIVQPLAI